jgi:hypothetical protein
MVDSAGVRWQALTEPPRCRHARVGTRWPGHAAMGRCGPLASGPATFLIFSRFSIFQILKFKTVTFWMSKIH